MIQLSSNQKFFFSLTILRINNPGAPLLGLAKSIHYQLDLKTLFPGWFAGSTKMQTKPCCESYFGLGRVVTQPMITNQVSSLK